MCDFRLPLWSKASALDDLDPVAPRCEVQDGALFHGSLDLTCLEVEPGLHGSTGVYDPDNNEEMSELYRACVEEASGLEGAGASGKPLRADCFLISTYNHRSAPKRPTGPGGEGPEAAGEL